MRKLTSLLLLFLTVVGTALADDFTPQSGKPYMIQCKGDSKFVLYNANCTKSRDDNTVILSNWANYDERSFFEVASTGDGYFTIKNLSSGLYVYAISTASADGNVGINALSGEATDAYKWTISAQGDGWNIIPKGGGCSWNNRGSYNGNGHVGQWDQNTNANNIWYFMTPSDFVTKQIITAPESPAIGQIATTPDVSAATTAATTLETTFSTENVTAFKTALSNYQSAATNLYLPSGLYTIKGLATDRHPYLYNDYLHAQNSAGYTLQAAAKGTTNNHYWKITNNGTSISVLNGQGTPMGVGNQNAMYNEGITKRSALNFAPYNETYYTDNPGIAFAEGLNLSNGNYYKLPDETRYLTTWTGHAEAQDCRFTFEAVEGDAYTVNITGTESYISEVPYATLAATSEIALNGGFFVLSSAPSAEDFSFSSACYTGTYSVDASAKTITLALSVTPAGVLSAEIATAQALLTEYAAKINTLGYPSAAAHSALSAAIATAQAKVDNGSATDDDITALQTAEATFKATKNMPVNGKAYTIVNVTSENEKSYLYWDDTNATYKAATLEAEATVPPTGVFVCREVGTGEYVFVSNSGKYLVWFCDEADKNTTGVANKGDVDAYNDNCIWTLYPADTKQNNAAKIGMFLLEGRTADARQQKRNYLLQKYSTHTFHSCEKGQVYDNGDLSSYWVLEEAAYPNTPNLKEAKGIDGIDGIATFSAPFATVVPAGVTAYNIESASVAGGATLVKVAEEGEALPASYGFILTGSIGEVTMVPCTTETPFSTDPGEYSTILSSTPGASRDLTPFKDYVYVLGLVDDVVGFYRIAETNPTIEMNKAYLFVPGSVGAAGFELNFGGQTTGIASAPAPAGADAPVFDLSGRRVARLQKGSLYIQNGKKFIAQ